MSEVKSSLPIHEQWKKEQKERIKEITSKKGTSPPQAHRSLYPISKKAKPIWDTYAFAAQCCESILQPAEGNIEKNFEAFDFLMQRTLIEQEEALQEDFSPADLQHCRTIGMGLRVCGAAWRKASYVVESTYSHCITSLVSEVGKRIKALRPGEILVFPMTGVVGTGCILVVHEMPSTTEVPEEGLDPETETVHVAFVDTMISNPCHPKVATAPAKLKMQTVLGVDNIPKSRAGDEGWWLWLVSARNMTKQAKPLATEVLYHKLYGWLTELQFATFEEAVQHWREEGSGKGNIADFKTPSRSSQGQQWRALHHSIKYLLRRQGMRKELAQLFALHMKRQLLKWTINDLHTVREVPVSSKKLITIACQDLARVSLKSQYDLVGTKSSIDYVIDLVEKMPCEDDGATAPPPPLDLNTNKEHTAQGQLFPLIECLRREEDVDDMAGPEIPQPRFIPSDFLAVPPVVEDFKQIMDALRDVDSLCTRLSVQSDVIKNSSHLKVSILTHLFLDVLPVPKGSGKCIWDEAVIQYSHQLDCSILLSRLAEHWASSVFSLKATPEFDAHRIVVLGVMTVMSDKILRIKPTDRESALCQHLNARLGETKTGYHKFGVGLGMFLTQSDTMQVTTPSLVVARAGVIDYFENLNILPDHILFKWEDTMKRDLGSSRLTQQIAQHNAFPLHSIPQYLVGDSDSHYLIIKNFPEFSCYRDICFYFKYMMSTVPNAFPSQNQYTQYDALLEWRFVPCVGYQVSSFRKMLSCKAKKTRWPSFAAASRFTFPVEAHCEDDILHIKSLPTFEDVLSQRESELLLSYLTVPYLRIPLVLNFFATDDRVSALRSDTIKRVLDSVLFEPSKFLPQHLEGMAPKQVPTECDKLLGTPYGLLVNEITNSPQGLIDPLLKLLSLALELDAGTVHNTSSVDVILYLVKTLARVDTYLMFVMSDKFSEISRVRIHNLETIKNIHSEIRATLRNNIVPMLEAWIWEVMKHHTSTYLEELESDIGHKDETVLPITTASQIAARIHSHLILLERSATPEETQTEESNCTVLSSFLFLTTRHTWNQGLLNVPETELYEVVQMRRRAMVQWLVDNEGPALNAVMRSAVLTATSAGTKVSAENCKGSYYQAGWGLVGGYGSIGRFTEIENIAKINSETVSVEKATTELTTSILPTHNITLADTMSVVPEGMQGTEVNVQTLQLTFKTAHLRALDFTIAGNIDVHTVLESVAQDLGTVQCADVERTSHRDWVRIVGQDLDVQNWKTSDPRVALPEQGRDYPEGVGEHEKWVLELAEPVRLAFFDRPPWEQPIILYFPDEEVGPETTCVCLEAVDSANGAKIKEIYVLRDHRAVHVYDIHSYGRRFYRTLVYSTDVRTSLLELQPSSEERLVTWPKWCRHGGGDPKMVVGKGESCVISRNRNVQRNQSGTTETFVPGRLLSGIVPDCLLYSHEFWQDDQDNIRGYPKKAKTGDKSIKDSKEHQQNTTHLIYLTLHDVSHGRVTSATSARIVRYANMGSCPTMKEGKKTKVKGATHTETDQADEFPRIRTTESDVTAMSESHDPKIHASIEDADMLLINLLYAPKGSPLHSLASVMMRLECLSHILAWTRDLSITSDYMGPVSVDLIQLPRLKLSFSAKVESDGTVRLYSLDHAHLFVSNILNDQLIRLLQGIPHSLILQDEQGQLNVLIPGFRVDRPTITMSPFSTEVVIGRSDSKWLDKLDTKYYLYPVHVSLSFMFTPTFASALYLLYLRLLYRDYEEVFRIATTIGTDTSLSKEEEQIFNRYSVNDAHPNILACFIKIGLLMNDGPVNCQWYMPKITAMMLVRQSKVSTSCKLSTKEELRTLAICEEIQQQMEILKGFREESPETFESLASTVTDSYTAALSGTLVQRRSQKELLVKIMNALSSKMGLRITKDGILRLIHIYDTFEDCVPLPVASKCILKNRRLYLEAQERGEASAVFTTPLLASDDGSFGKLQHLDHTWATSTDKELQSLTVAHVFQKTISGGSAVDLVLKIIEPYSDWYSKQKHGDVPESLSLKRKEAKKKKERNKYRFTKPRHQFRRHPIQQSVDDGRLKLDGQMDQYMSYVISWLTLYQMMINQTKCKVGLSSKYYGLKAENVSFTVASIARHFMRDAHDPGIPQSVLHTLARNPQMVSRLPRFPTSQDGGEIKKSDRAWWEVQMKNIQGLGKKKKTKENVDPTAPPLLNLVTEFQRIGREMLEKDELNKMLESKNQPVEGEEKRVARFIDQEDLKNTHTVVVKPLCTTRTSASISLSETAVAATVADCGCNERVVPPLLLGKLGGVQLNDKVLLSHANKRNAEAQAKCFATQPLGIIGIDQFVCYRARNEIGLPEIPPQLPFDLHPHPNSKTAVAETMLQRLETDMKEFASQMNDSRTPQLRGLTTESLNNIVQQPACQETDDLISNLGRLLTAVTQARDVDASYVEAALPALESASNYIPPGAPDSDVFSLRRFAGDEVRVHHEYLFGTLLSTQAHFDLQKLNPFLTNDNVDTLLHLVTYTVLHSNRLGQLNKLREELHGLISMLSSLKQGQPTGNTSGWVAAIKQKADNVANVITQGRAFVEFDDSTKTLTYDPKFLMFEFTWNILLRRRQIEMVKDFLQCNKLGESHVKQMIMGAGKTTVVGPLLALNVADGSTLLLQVVPQSLLDFTCSIMRSTFSTIMQKQIFTFLCDRTSEINAQSYQKFLHARDSMGVVLTTPSSVKSVWLKMIETLDKIDSRGKQVSDTCQKQVTDLANIIDLWRGSVLILDEVDMLLHPLRSELNFPIGEKKEVDFAPLRWKLPTHLIDALFYPSLLRMSMPFKESSRANQILCQLDQCIKVGYNLRSLQYTPHLILLDREYYFKEMQPLLGEWSLLFLESQGIVTIPSPDVLKYIISRPEDDDDLKKKIESLPSNQVRLLNLVSDWLNSYLPHVISKINRVSFGLMTDSEARTALEEQPTMPQTRIALAIPFIGKDQPSHSSEFAHPDVVIGLTLLAYRLQGLRVSDFREVLKSIQSSVEAEVGRYALRRTNLLYEKWVKASGGHILKSFNYKADRVAEVADEIERSTSEVGLQPSESFELMREHTDDSHVEESVEVAPLRLLKQANEGEVKKLYHLLKLVPEVCHWYLAEVVFPEYMRHQNKKLSASGQELGGDMLFKVRLGFSGTPSDLLPQELGSCGYEKATDGQLITTLTDPNIVSHQLLNNWSVRGLLNKIAQADPPFHALIDTGALITGMDNLSVASYLLQNGLNSMEGVVFLDSQDRKMILVRVTGRVLKLEECGIPVEKRFSFYDQVHTTGIDISHAPNAQAVLTLGKDMTFRDFSQGAYRMRGIGRGQTIQLFVIPEVGNMVTRDLKYIKIQEEISPKRRSLCEVVAWLLVNSMRSERLQYNQLALQSVSNVWRKELFNMLNSNKHKFTIDGITPTNLKYALNQFREPIDFDVKATVPESRMFSEYLQEFIGDNVSFIKDEKGLAIMKSIQAQVLREDETHKPQYDVELVQEQEEEKEAEIEQEQEQEVEIEKFVDQAYARDEETPSTWMFDTLGDVSTAVQFYPAGQFKMYKRRPIDLPPDLLISCNYFNPYWTGNRRIKNSIMTMEWIPREDELRILRSPTRDYCTLGVDESTELLGQAISPFGDINEQVVKRLVSVALDVPSSEVEEANLGTDIDSVVRVLESNEFREEESGRYTVALSLCEAETIRRIMHIRAASGDPLLRADSKTHISLRCIPSSNKVIDCTPGFPRQRRDFQIRRSCVCMRFLDSDLHFSSSDLSLLLRALHKSPAMNRQLFFQQLLACRRRSRQKWEQAPIAKVFQLMNAFSLLMQKAIGAACQNRISDRGMHIGDAFLAFNSSKSGHLTPGEMWGALTWLGVDVKPEDILDFIAAADTSGEGNVGYQDFLQAVVGSSEEDDTLVVGDEGRDLPVIAPRGEAELQNLRNDRAQKLAESESEALRALAEEDKLVGKMIEEDEDRALQEAGMKPNPEIDNENNVVYWEFERQKLPRGVVALGRVSHAKVSNAHPFPFWDVSRDSALQVTVAGESKKHTQFCVTLEVKFPKGNTFPAFGCALVQVNGGTVTISSDGTAGWEDKKVLKEAEEQAKTIINEKVNRSGMYGESLTKVDGGGGGGGGDLDLDIADRGFSSDEDDSVDDEFDKEAGAKGLDLDIDFDEEALDARFAKVIAQWVKERAKIPKHQQQRQSRFGGFGPSGMMDDSDSSDSDGNESEDEEEEKEELTPEERKKKEAAKREEDAREAAAEAEEAEKRRKQKEKEERGLPKKVQPNDGTWHIVTIICRAERCIAISEEEAKAQAQQENSYDYSYWGATETKPKAEPLSPEQEAMQVFINGRKMEVDKQPSEEKELYLQYGDDEVAMSLFNVVGENKDLHMCGGSIRNCKVETDLSEGFGVQDIIEKHRAILLSRQTISDKGETKEEVRVARKKVLKVALPRSEEASKAFETARDRQRTFRTATANANTLEEDSDEDIEVRVTGRKIMARDHSLFARADPENLNSEPHKSISAIQAQLHAAQQTYQEQVTPIQQQQQRAQALQQQLHRLKSANKTDEIAAVEEQCAELQRRVQMITTQYNLARIPLQEKQTQIQLKHLETVSSGPNMISEYFQCKKQLITYKIQKKNTEAEIRSSDASHMQQVYNMKAAQAKNEIERQSFQQKAQKMQVRIELMQSRSAQKTRALQEKVSELDKKCSELGLGGYHRFVEDWDEY
eukprot:TRINITY_DN1420_c0_g1_i1.p1 TRINITY_DN1420_c0_g1~~TRINITY_DN1420_c0_g1_i1.p1  ORF type:complete len:4698 (+),score=1051.93 TRINITY_DN1420_c0_g1_i1:123-14216(+)